MAPDSKSPASLRVERKSADLVVVHIAGDWRSHDSLPDIEPLIKELNAKATKAVELETSGLGDWNSRFVGFISKCMELCRERHVEFRNAGLPEGVRDLMRLATAVPEAKGARQIEAPPPFFARVGERGITVWNEVQSLFTFLGEMVLAMVQLIKGKAQFRWRDAFLVMQECGPQALGIVALINFLIGLIMAFVGATSLAQFGASIYVADMVAIGTVREMGSIMTGIILCGRTGAAFAAQLGTMKVNEEITALQTFGISPVEFLVLPRMIAMMLMMPLLCVFADFIGILGGFTVSLGMLDGTATEYIDRTIQAIQLKSFVLGVAKGSFFGFLVAYTGCLRGMQCGSNAAAVGEATTRAVVAGITAIIAADGVFAVICNALDI